MKNTMLKLNFGMIWNKLIEVHVSLIKKIKIIIKWMNLNLYCNFEWRIWQKPTRDRSHERNSSILRRIVGYNWCSLKVVPLEWIRRICNIWFNNQHCNILLVHQFQIWNKILLNKKIFHLFNIALNHQFLN